MKIRSFDERVNSNFDTQREKFKTTKLFSAIRYIADSEVPFEHAQMARASYNNMLLKVVGHTANGHEADAYSALLDGAGRLQRIADAYNAIQSEAKEVYELAKNNANIKMTDAVFAPPQMNLHDVKFRTVEGELMEHSFKDIDDVVEHFQKMSKDKAAWDAARICIREMQTILETAFEDMSPEAIDYCFGGSRKLMVDNGVFYQKKWKDGKKTEENSKTWTWKAVIRGYWWISLAAKTTMGTYPEWLEKQFAAMRVDLQEAEREDKEVGHYKLEQEKDLNAKWDRLQIQQEVAPLHPDLWLWARRLNKLVSWGGVMNDFKLEEYPAEDTERGARDWDAVQAILHKRASREDRNKLLIID
jgi:hypothetical protein